MAFSTLAMAVLDGTIVTAARPTMARQLAVAPENAIWIVNAFQLSEKVAGPGPRPCNPGFAYSAATAGAPSRRDPTVHALTAARCLPYFGVEIIAARTPATIWRSSFPARISARIEANTLPAASTVQGGGCASCAG
jgi:hypothetical protein